MPLILGQLAGPALMAGLLALFGRGGGGDDQVGGELDPELQARLMDLFDAQIADQALVNPTLGNILGVTPEGAVPLRQSANRLAFALLPNFVRPSNSAFPGTDTPFFGTLASERRAGVGGGGGVTSPNAPTFAEGDKAAVQDFSQFASQFPDLPLEPAKGPEGQPAATAGLPGGELVKPGGLQVLLDDILGRPPTQEELIEFLNQAPPRQG